MDCRQPRCRYSRSPSPVDRHTRSRAPSPVDRRMLIRSPSPRRRSPSPRHRHSLARYYIPQTQQVQHAPADRFPGEIARSCHCPCRCGGVRKPPRQSSTIPRQQLQRQNEFRHMFSELHMIDRIDQILKTFSSIQNAIIVDAANNMVVDDQANWATLIDALSMLLKRPFILVVRDRYHGPIPENVTVLNLESSVNSADICMFLAHVLRVPIATRAQYPDAHAPFQRQSRCEISGLENNLQYFQIQVQMKAILESASIFDASFVKRAFACGDDEESWVKLFDDTIPESIRAPIRALARNIRPLDSPKIILRTNV